MEDEEIIIVGKMTSGTSGIMLVVILEVELMGLIALQIIMFKINIEP